MRTSSPTDDKTELPSTSSFRPAAAGGGGGAVLSPDTPSVNSTTTGDDDDWFRITAAFPRVTSMNQSASGSSLSDAMPLRSASAASGSGNPLIEEPAVILRNRLADVTKFAFLDLIASIFRFDFWDPTDKVSVEFCKSTFELILQQAAFPEKTNVSLRYHLEGEGASDDIAAFVRVIRDDAYVRENGNIVLLGCLLMIFVEDGDYDCRYRVLLRHMSALLSVRWDDFEDMEDTLTDTILGKQYVESEDSKAARAKNTRMKKFRRYALIGAATGVGGVLIGLTGGLAAPLVAAGAGVVIGTGAAAGIATTAGAAVLGSIFGVAGAGLAGYKMKKRVGEIEEFTIEALSDGSSLHCVLVVSGWIDELSDRAFHHQWRHLWMSREQYTLRYESRYLIELGQAIDYLMSFAVSMAIQQTLLETALHGLMIAVAWPVALLGSASVLDNPWNVCVSRAAEVGEHLAEILLSRAHGKRPITLIGFSLGARVIYHCLLAMSKRDNCLGVIEDVVLLGAPVSASPKQWSQICRVVGGRVINGYCNTDWLLRFIYRTMSVQFTIAGTGPVRAKNNDRKIVNFNVSHIVKGHLDYSRKLTEVLDAVGVKVTPRSDQSIMDLAKYAADSERCVKWCPSEDGASGGATDAQNRGTHSGSKQSPDNRRSSSAPLRPSTTHKRSFEVEKKPSKLRESLSDPLGELLSEPHHNANQTKHHAVEFRRSFPHHPSGQATRDFPDQAATAAEPQKQRSSRLVTDHREGGDGTSNKSNASCHRNVSARGLGLDLEAKQETGLEAKEECGLEAKQETGLEAKQECGLEAAQECGLEAKQECGLEAKQECGLEATQETGLEAFFVDQARIEREHTPAEKSGTEN